MKTNKKPAVPQGYTHEGAKSPKVRSPLQQLRRSCMACFLWEDSFYEDGESHAARVASLVAKCKPSDVAALAIHLRKEGNLRHMPLFLVRELARTSKEPKLVEDTLFTVIQRPDEIGEFLSIYWKDGKIPIARQVKRGLARAFGKFTEFQLAKYNSSKADIRLRDVMRLVHPVPVDNVQEDLFGRLLNDQLETPKTWETELSAGKDKRATFMDLLQSKSLGGLALLRNLRNMRESGVPNELIVRGLDEMKTDRILPFRFITAARYAPDMEPHLEAAMLRCLADTGNLMGRTLMMVDVSGSMDISLSSSSDMTRMDAACGLAILLREVCESVDVYSFSRILQLVPTRRGFALRDAIIQSQPHRDTFLAQAFDQMMRAKAYDRVIVITDEQADQPVGNPLCKLAYMLNVASYKNGISNRNWIRIDGWSDSVVKYMVESEKDLAPAE